MRGITTQASDSECMPRWETESWPGCGVRGQAAPYISPPGQSACLTVYLVLTGVKSNSSLLKYCVCGGVGGVCVESGGAGSLCHWIIHLTPSYPPVSCLSPLSCPAVSSPIFPPQGQMRDGMAACVSHAVCLFQSPDMRGSGMGISGLCPSASLYVPLCLRVSASVADVHSGLLWAALTR